MPRTTKTPAYRLYKRTGQAVVTLNGRDYYLGKHGTGASRQAYDRLIGEWLTGGRSLLTEDDPLTIIELVARFWRHAERYYRKADGTPTTEPENFRLALRPLKALYGHTAAREFGPLALKAVRQRMTGGGGSRNYVNKHIRRIKLMFKWAASEELVPSAVFHSLQTVVGLKRGRTDARETEPVKPVPEEHVDAVRPHVSRQVCAIIELQRLTGMRSGEVLMMRGRDLDMTGKLWLYRLASHKTEHHGYERVVELGPRAREVIRPFLKPDLEEFLFSPADAEAERRAELHRKRKTAMSCGNRPGTNRKRKPKRVPKERYTPDSYRRAVARACDLADLAAKKRRDLPPDSERIIPRWHPHRLRHNYGTRIRKEFGVEAARILLGHRSTAVTELYAEVDRGRVRDIVARVG